MPPDTDIKGRMTWPSARNGSPTQTHTRTAHKRPASKDSHTSRYEFLRELVWPHIFFTYTTGNFLKSSKNTVFCLGFNFDSNKNFTWWWKTFFWSKPSYKALPFQQKTRSAKIFVRSKVSFVLPKTARFGSCQLASSLLSQLESPTWEYASAKWP